MGFEIDTSATTMVQQASTALFDGLTEVGRAALSHGIGAARVTVRAKKLGAPGNDLSLAIVDAGRPVSRTLVREVGNTVAVVPRRDASAILATSDEVAAAINAARLKVVAHGAGSGVVTPLAESALAGGIDPHVIAGCQYKFEQYAGLEAGLFYFDQQYAQNVTQIEGTFSITSETTLTVQLVNLSEGLEPLPAEAASIYRATLSPSVSSFVITDARILLLPYRAVRVLCAAPGNVRVHARRETAGSST